jgi:hypothetical protein
MTWGGGLRLAAPFSKKGQDMEIRIIKNCGGAGFAYSKKSVVVIVPDDRGRDLIRAGYAVDAKEAKAEAARAEKTVKRTPKKETATK